MPDNPDFEALRTAVHEVCVEANKGIFNNLEAVLLCLVDAIEAASVPKVDANGLWRCHYGRLHGSEVGMCECKPGDPPTTTAALSTDLPEAYTDQLKAGYRASFDRLSSTEQKGERRDG